MLFSMYDPLHIRYARGELMVQSGTYAAGIALIVSGIVQESYASDHDGDHEATEILGPGDLIGFEVLLDGPHALHQTTARALTSVRLAFLERSTLQRALCEDSAIRNYVLMRLSTRVLSLKASLARAHAPLGSRLLWLLLELGKKSGQEISGDRMTLPPEIDRRVIADLLDVSTRRLSRIWKDLVVCGKQGKTPQIALSRLRTGASGATE